jgi:hypothetical protein
MLEPRGADLRMENRIDSMSVEKHNARVIGNQNYAYCVGERKRKRFGRMVTSSNRKLTLRQSVRGIESRLFKGTFDANQP